MRRVLICGDRYWTNYALVLRWVQRAHAVEAIDVIIEGECPYGGADIHGREAGKACGITVLPFPAEWKRLGRAAGPVRNQRQLDEGKPTEVWAFHNNLAASSGTRDMVERSKKAGLPVYMITETGWTKWVPNTLF